MMDIYNIFLDNHFKKNLYRVEFKDGKEITGIPSVGSFVDPTKLGNLAFSLKHKKDGKQITDRFPLSSVSKVEPI